MSAQAVRAQLAAHLLTGYGLLRQSPEPVAFIRSAQRSPVHLEYAVSVDSTQPIDGPKDLVSSEVHVVIAYQLPPKDRVTGYDTMLGIERTVVASLQTSDWGGLNPRLASLTPVQSARQPGPDGWIWLVITFTALHYTL